MNGSSKLARWLRRCLLAAGALIVALVAAVALRALYSFRDRHPGYQVVMSIREKPAPPPGQFRAGFARVKINPDLSRPGRPVWLAGFSNHRAATGQHDDLWAIAGVFDDGQTRLGVVALDAIGFFHDDVIEVRRRLSPDWKLDYVIICATHNHSTPDLMGLWGESFLRTGVDRDYRQQVIAASARGLGDAVAGLQPAQLTLHEIPTPTAGLVADTRDPQVFDPDIRVMLLMNPANGQTIGSLVAWANHPEVLWGGNQEITSDFCGYLREALENGLRHEGRVWAEGLGGIHLYVNGAIGGLMTPHPKVSIRDPCLEQEFSKPSHEKARALGHNLARRILDRVKSAPGKPEERLAIWLEAKTLQLPVANPNFLLAPVLGLLDRGQARWRTLRSEVALLGIGNACLVTIPGEIYPELVNGGIENPPGADFSIAPVEVPPIRELMPGTVKFVLGLANDEVGYIIPKSEWDRQPPWLYNSPRRVYGEVNSLGPDTAQTLHRAIQELAERRIRGAKLPGQPTQN